MDQRSRRTPLGAVLVGLLACLPAGCAPRECEENFDCGIGNVCSLDGRCSLGGHLAGRRDSREAPRAPDDDDDAAVDPVAGLDAAPAGSCVVGPVQPELGLDPFYGKYCDVDGLGIVASVRVSDAALGAVNDIMRQMFARPDVVDALREQGTRVAIIGADELTRDIPEYRWMPASINNRARGLGGTPQLPLASCAEENVLCAADDRWFGESVLVHELAHTVQLVGLDAVDPTFSPRLEDAFEAAMGAGLWRSTYATTDALEYFAVATQSVFEVIGDRDPADGVRGPINTRAELAAYDPGVYALVDEAFPGATLDWRCRAP
ncbi:MAG: hypothetical protein Q8O67_09425 [Deltaproteobacteria bacterium]|nr:hypothetical protein [Deltaproteobacteria bacterium]